MSQYNPVTPTIKGQAMIAESLKTKTGLVFTKVEWGDGIVSRGEQYPTFTALKNKVIESPISKMERQDATLYITSVVNNSTLSTGFYCREIGVWAKIGANGTEQLFAYTYAENASYTPSSNQYNEKRIRIGLGVDANVNVTIKFNSEVYLTRQELEDHNTDPTAHPDIRQMISQKADKTVVDNIVNTVPIISILTGTCRDGETIPLPDGYTESQCKIFVSMAILNPDNYWFDVTENGANNMLRTECYTDGRILRCAMVTDGFDGWRPNRVSGPFIGPRKACVANYMVIGIKYGG